MTNADNNIQVIQEILNGLAVRACDLLDRECAVEEGRDHHVALVLLAAGHVLLSGLPHQDAGAATASMLPAMCELVHAEALRRQNERDPSMS